MQQILLFHTGKTTCSERPAGPNSMCPFVYGRKFGTQPVCHLFGDARLSEEGGWLQRLPQCVELFKGWATMNDVMERIEG